MFSIPQLDAPPQKQFAHLEICIACIRAYLLEVFFPAFVSILHHHYLHMCGWTKVTTQVSIVSCMHKSTIQTKQQLTRRN